MKLGEIAAYGVGTIGLVTMIDSFYTMDSLDLDKHGKICPDPPPEVARMFEIQRVFHSVHSGLSHQYDLSVQEGTETSISLRNILTDTEVEMKYKGLLKEYDTLAASSEDEVVEYVASRRENNRQMNHSILLVFCSILPLAVGYSIGYEMTKERRQKEKEQKDKV